MRPGKQLLIAVSIAGGIVLSLVAVLWWIRGSAPPTIAAMKTRKEEAAPAPSPAVPTGWTITGRALVTGLAGEIVPATGVTVRLGPDPDPRLEQEQANQDAVAPQATATDREGRFELHGVQERLRVQIEIDDGVHAVEGFRLRMPRLAGSGREDLGDWLLRTGSTLKIRVSGSDDAPIERALLLVWPTGDWVIAESELNLGRPCRLVRNHGKGEYVIERVAPGGHRVRAVAPGFVEHFQSFELPGDGPIHLELDAGQEISGIVVTPDGAPVADADVLAGTNLDLEVKQRARSDPAGRFTLHDLDDADYEVSAGGDGFIDDCPRKQRVGSGTSNLRLVLEPAPPFRARVVDEENRKPIGGAEVSMYGCWPEYETRTDAQGFFQFRRRGQRLIKITVEHEDFLTLNLAPSEAEELDLHQELVIALSRGSSVAGRVFDAASGAPVTDAMVSAIQAGGQFNVTRGPFRTGPEGFLLRGLSAGTWTIEAHRRGYRRAARALELDGKMRMEDISFPLERGSSMNGRVLDPTGSPVAAARVTAALESTPELWGSALLEQTACSDSQGRFRLEGLPAGETITLFASHPERNLAWQTGIKVAPPPGDGGVTISFVAAGAVEGRILDVKGQPIPGAQVLIAASDWPERFGKAYRYLWLERPVATCKSDAQGKYVFRRVPPGPHSLEVRTDGFVFRREAVRIEEGRTVTGVDVVLEQGKTMSGRVVDEAGQIVAGARLFIFGGDSRETVHYQRAKTDANGEFRIFGLREIEYRLSGSYRELSGDADVLAPAHGVELRLEKHSRR